MTRLTWTSVLAALSLLAASAAATAQEPAKPLFADEGLIHIVVKGPIVALIHRAARSEEASAAEIGVAGAGAMLPIQLAARGRTRRQSGICEFPPLRITFAERPGPGSLFEGQKKLKLVTHCQPSSSFQQYVLQEYSIYRMFNLLTPLSFRARLAMVDYVEPNGRTLTSHLGYLLEDAHDVARRNGLDEAKLGDRISSAQLEPTAAARDAVFQYMIGNLDWSMIASPKGEACCHNTKLVAPKGAQSGFLAVPYDYDSSGLVDTPYAAPPKGIDVSDVKVRRYRGYCRNNAEARAAASDMLAKRGEIEAAMDGIPQFEDSTRRKARAYLDSFFSQMGSQAGVDRMLKTCIG